MSQSGTGQACLQASTRGPVRHSTTSIAALKAKALSLREIAEELRVRGQSISHTAIDRLMKEVGYVGPKSVRPQLFDAPEDD